MVNFYDYLEIIERCFNKKMKLIKGKKVVKSLTILALVIFHIKMVSFGLENSILDNQVIH